MLRHNRQPQLCASYVRSGGLHSSFPSLPDNVPPPHPTPPRVLPSIGSQCQELLEDYAALFGDGGSAVSYRVKWYEKAEIKSLDRNFRQVESVPN